MAAPRMKVSVADDMSTACLTLLPASGVEGDVVLTFEQLDTLIARLGQARAAIAEKRGTPSIEGVPFVPVYQTSWAVQPEALTEGSVIAFQHPSYGPVGFVVPPSDIETIVRALSTHLGMLHSRGHGKPS